MKSPKPRSHRGTLDLAEGIAKMDAMMWPAKETAKAEAEDPSLAEAPGVEARPEEMAGERSLMLARFEAAEEMMEPVSASMWPPETMV